MTTTWAHHLAPLSLAALLLGTGCIAEGVPVDGIGDTEAVATADSALTARRTFPGSLLERMLDTQFASDNDIAEKGRLRVEYRDSHVADGTLVATGNATDKVATIEVSIPSATIEAKAIRDRIIGGDKKRDVNIHLYNLTLMAKYDVRQGVANARLLTSDSSVGRINAEGAGLLGERVEAYIDHHDSKVRQAVRKVVLDYIKDHGDELFRSALGL